MNERSRLLVGGFFCMLLLAPIFSMAQETASESTFCKLAGWLVRPVGLCEQSKVAETIEVYTPETPIDLTEKPVVAPPPVIIEYSTTTQPVYNDIKNEYVTVNQTGVSEDLLNSRVAELLFYIDSLPHGINVERNSVASLSDSGSDYVTKEFLEKSVDKVYDQLSDIPSDYSELDFNDTVLLGDTFVSGRLGVGTATPLDVLSVAGAVYLSATTPADTTNRLYNSGSNLYWDGSLLTGASATTSVWGELSGNAVRPTGNVGIGTTTPSDTLTVDGSIGADSVTAELVDSGGVVCNVEAYGAVGDNSTLNDAAIARAIAACPDGGTVFFPMGEFRIANTIVLDKPVTLRGSYSPRWSYSSAPRSSIRADFGSFSGVALVHVRDRSISGEVADNNGGRIEHLSLDGGSASTGVEGIYFEGLVRDWKLTDVDISQVTGNGFEAAVGAGSGNPRGFTIRGLSIYSADGHGFRATALNDSYIDDLLAVGNSLRGIYLSSMGETKVANSRAVFNGLTGLYIDGATANGGISFTDFSTDRNDRHGVRISATGTSTIIFNGLLTRRDGPNTSGGTETPYAGVAIIGSPTEKVAPVFISGLGQTVGVDDSGVPPLSPSTGVRVTNAEYVKVDGQLWGVDESWRDGGGNDFFLIEDDAILKTGTAGAKELFTNDRKWQSTSTDELIFGNRVSIGSSTDSRLLNIVAPNNAGARFKDTTNGVTFDMRAEDFQAFFGTFSDHQLRFQTNNTSRLTIDTNGRIGIGTTTPVTNLSVVGDGYFTGAFRDSNNNRGLLGQILQTTGTQTQWVSTSTLGISGGGSVAFGVDNQIPFMNAGGTDYDYSSSFTFDGSFLTVDGDIIPGVNQMYDLGSNANRFVNVWTETLNVGTSTWSIFNSDGNALSFSNAAEQGGTELFTILNNGNIGIGTTTPPTKLSIAQSTAEDGLSIFGTGAQAADFGALSIDTLGQFVIQAGGAGIGVFKGTTGAPVAGWSDSAFAIADDKELELGTDSDYSIGYNSSDDTLRIVNGNNVSSDANTFMAFTSAGNIGIGTTTPNQTLDIIGTIQASNLLGGATTLSTDVNGNIIRTPSDKKLKKNINNIEDALDIVLGLQGVRYDWKDAERFGTQTEIGFIAQDVDELIPEVVRKGGEYWALNTPNMLAVVVEAMKEMWEVVSGNKEKISTLEERVQNLEELLEVDTQPEPEEEEEVKSSADAADGVEDDTSTTSASSTDVSLDSSEDESASESSEDSEEDTLSVEVSQEPEVVQGETKVPEEIIENDSQETVVEEATEQ